MCPGRYPCSMPRALGPRHGKPSHGTPRRSAPLPRDVVDDVRQTARPAQAQEALGHLERAVELLGRGDPRQAVKEARKAKDAAPVWNSNAAQSFLENTWKCRTTSVSGTSTIL